MLGSSFVLAVAAETVTERTSAANATIVTSFFILSPLSSGARGSASAGCGRSKGGPAARSQQRPDSVDRGETDEAVDDPARGVGVTEVEAATDPGDEVELGDRHEAPVEAADEHEGRGQQVELLH